MNHHGGGVRGTHFAKPTEPAPTPVRQLHVGQRLHARFNHPRHLCGIIDRVPQRPLPVERPDFRVPQFLRVQVGSLAANLLKVQPHIPQDVAGNNRGQKAVQRLLGAAMRIRREKR